MASPLPLRARPWIGQIVRIYEERFTARGRFLFWAMAAFALVGADTRRTRVFLLFAIAFALLAAASLQVRLRRPRLALAGRLPHRLTALRPIPVQLRVSSEAPGPVEDVVVSLPRSWSPGAAPSASQGELYVGLSPQGPTEVALELAAPRRGRFQMRGPTARATDSLRLVTSRAVRIPDENLIVYPRYFSIEELAIPLGRRYQPGGIPLTSSTGDAIEFIGTRDYREGDPLRNIHWRSWARRGQPVVKEFQQEYFCRIALILDTYLPRRDERQEREAFEAGISVLASVADYFARGEYVVDVLAAGPDVYQVSAGRSLAYLENILDVLACLEPCYDPPFARIGPVLFDRLAGLTTVVAVLQDWDEPREAFLRQVRIQGTSVRGFVVRHGEPSRPLPVDDEFGEITALPPDEVERVLASGGSMRIESSGPAVGALVG